jgi:hypothetical protein
LLAAAAGLLVCEMLLDSMWVLGAAHIFAGGAAYFLWSCLPPQDKKNDCFPTFI